MTPTPPHRGSRWKRCWASCWASSWPTAYRRPSWRRSSSLLYAYRSAGRWDWRRPETALLGCRQTGDYRWLDGKYYEKLKKYIDYWFWHCDSDKNGLFFWDGSDHSGMDNQALRLGYDGVMEFEGVDLNVYLVRELRAMAQLALELGKA